MQTVVELTNVDLAGFETDLGLLPGGRLKLVKAHQINLDQTRGPLATHRFHTLGLAAPPNTTHSLFVATSLGRVLRLLRHDAHTNGLTTLKSRFDDGSAQVTSLQFHHQLRELLLAGYGNGELRLYHVKYSMGNFFSFVFCEVPNYGFGFSVCP